MFTNVASNYDLMNDLMSLGIHRLWKDALIDWLNPQPGQQLLDVAGGTGDISFRFIKRAKGTVKATVLDMTEAMLVEGKKRSETENLSGSLEWVCGDAMSLPFKNNSFDVYTISFGIRNISSSEILFMKKNKKRIKIYWAKDKSKWNLSEFKKIIKNKKVYLTFDVDGLDLSIMPATGTPEPGGLFWDETMSIIKIAAQSSHIVGADINELSPIKGFNSYNFLAAKLAYKIISYSFKFKKLDSK